MPDDPKRPARSRANGEGSIFQESNGRYRIAVTVWQNGKRKRKTRTAWKKSEAVAILGELRGDSTLPSAGLTVGTYLERWLSTAVDPVKQPATHDSYKRAIDKHITPHLGHVKLTKLSPVHVDDWLTTLRDNDIGSRTVENAYTVFSAALDRAVKPLKLIAESPLIDIKKPRHTAEEILPFTIAESKAILAATAGTRNHAVMCLGLMAGMRSGEIFGLRKNRIDWKKRTIKIDQQVRCLNGKLSLEVPKTKSSIRTIPMSKPIEAALKAHLALMEAEGNGSKPLVFFAPEGGLVSRTTFRTRVWLPLLKKLKIDARGFHHTRHTFATVSLGEGVNPVVISKRLGHAKVSTTLDIYSHALEKHHAQATDIIANLFG